MERFVEGSGCNLCGNTKRYRKGGACVVCARRRANSAPSRYKPRGTWKHRLSQKDTLNKTALCTACGQVELILKGKVWRCKSGNKKLQTRYREHNRQYQRLVYERTKGKPRIAACDICHNEAKLCWDHDHKTGLHRGWLCHYCNVGIGFLKDDISILKSAIMYLTSQGGDLHLVSTK